MQVIALDAMGGDNAPKAIVQGAALAAKELGVHILLVGRTKDIEREISQVSAPANAFTIVEAPDIIETHEKPTSAVRRKKQSSMMVGLKTVKEGRASAFISAGSTGALLTAATVVVGRSEGIERPALGVLIPRQEGFTFLLDCGANVDCKPSYLEQFARLGSDYVSQVLNIQSPRVGLINVGAEQEKGNMLTKEAYSLLEQSGLNFTGNVEARDIPLGAVDVAVCDAFVGNIVLKYTEGLAKGILGIIKTELTADPLSKVGALLAKGAFKRIKQHFNYDDMGGAAFLGLNKLVVKAHGSSNAAAICGAVRQCIKYSKEREMAGGI